MDAACAARAGHGAHCAFDLDFTRNSEFHTDSSVRFIMNEYLRDHNAIHRLVALEVNQTLSDLVTALSTGLFVLK